jgi:hypothetical protein
MLRDFEFAEGKFMRYRSLFSRPAVIMLAVALVTGTFAWSQLGGGAAGATTTLDSITYNQQTGSNGTYIQYVPGDGSKTTKQSVTSGGGCATPTPSGTPILAFSANYYPNGYANAPTTAIVGAYKSRTGVCQIPQAWSIEQNESLTFGVGANSLVAGREFSRAVLQLEREDKSTSSDPAVQVQLVLREGTNVVATQTVSLPGPNGGTLPAVDTGSAVGFTSIEIRVLSPAAGSISVVGPTSSFYLANKICGGQTITNTSTGGTASTGEVTASFKFDAPATTCKSYTTFQASSTDPTSSTFKSVSFFSQQLAGAHMLATFDWGYFPYCRPDLTPDPAHPTATVCPTTTVDFGSGDTNQTFCAPNGATTTTPWCTTSKHYDYVSDPAGSGATLVHITETWDGLGDVTFRRG